MGAKSVVITGFLAKAAITRSWLLEARQMEAKFIRTRSFRGETPGPGDVFSSVLARDFLNGKSLAGSVAQAAGFVKEMHPNCTPSRGADPALAIGAAFEKNSGGNLIIDSSEESSPSPFFFLGRNMIYVYQTRVLRRNAVRFR